MVRDTKYGDRKENVATVNRKVIIENIYKIENRISLSNKSYKIQKELGSKDAFNENIYFTKAQEKNIAFVDVSSRSMKLIQRQPPEKSFNEIIFKLNGKSVIKNFTENSTLDKLNEFLKKELDCLLYQLQILKKESEETIRGTSTTTTTRKHQWENKWTERKEEKETWWVSGTVHKNK